MKLKERVLIAVLAGVVLLTVFIVLDVETRITNPHRMTPSHARVQYNFRQRHLQKTANGSREGASQQLLSAGDEGLPKEQRLDKGSWDEKIPKKGSWDEKIPKKGSWDEKIPNKEIKPLSSSTKKQLHDTYVDLARLAQKSEDMYKVERIRRTHWNPTIGDLLGLELGTNATLWDRFHITISRDALYPVKDPVVPALLHRITQAPILHMNQKEGGTQLKLILEFDDGGHALVKPMRFTREQQTLKNHFYFTDYERHNAEIAAFHLDRVLGFRRAVPVVGRLMNITRDLYALAQGDLLKTFFISPDNNLCFHGKCSYYCDTSHAICGNPDMLEVSLAVFLPGKDAAPRKVWRHPWRRSYHKRRRAQWEVDDDYCDLVREVHPYNTGRRLLDLMDMAILDFLMGNMDRHHYETFKMFGNNSAPIHLDHGRGFGKPFHDEISILAPLYQCCMIRHSTLATLTRFQGGPRRFSEAMRDSMAEDPLAPVLWEPHLEAMDRRLGIILQIVRECVHKVQNPFDVIINDFH